MGSWRTAGVGMGVLYVIASARAHAQPDDVETAPWLERAFGETRVICSPDRTCYVTARAVVSDAWAEQGFVEIARDAAPDAAPRIRVGVERRAAPGLMPRAVVRVLDGDRLVASETLVRRGEENERYYALTGDTLALARTLSDAQRVELEIANGAYVVIPLTGSSAAMRFMDERQGRAGTPSAIVARGTAPARATTGAPPVSVRRAQAVSQDALPRTVPAYVRAQRPCGPTPAIAEATVVARLAHDTLLYRVRCGESPRSLIDVYYVRDDRSLRPVARDQAAGLSHSTYDPTTRLLTTEHPARCAFETRWAWTGRSFALVRHSLETCGHDVVAYEARVTD